MLSTTLNPAIWLPEHSPVDSSTSALTPTLTPWSDKSDPSSTWESVQTRVNEAVGLEQGLPLAMATIKSASASLRTLLGDVIELMTLIGPPTASPRNHFVATSLATLTRC